jgi:uncharacterized protein YjbJ (UPF0337 family)
MKNEEDKKRKNSTKELPPKKNAAEEFKEKIRAAYSEMGKLGGLARAKQLAEKGFRSNPSPLQKSKTSHNPQRRKTMNINIIKGQWHVIKGKLKEQWGRLTDNDIMQIEGSIEELAGALQKAYGYDQDEAHKEIRKFIDTNKWEDG